MVGAALSFLLTVTPVFEQVPVASSDPPEIPEVVTLTADFPPFNRLRGDWESPDAVLLAFTFNWPESLPALVKRVADSADVLMVVERGSGRRAARRWVERIGLSDQVELLEFEVDTPWVRDYGPFQVQGADGKWKWLDAGYEGRPRDDEVPRHLASHVGVTLEPLDLPLDGGAVSSNGMGFCVSTVDYFEENDIDHRDEPLMEGMLQKLGCRTMLLVPSLLDEETKHADVVVQFVSPNRAMVASVEPLDSWEDAARMDAVAKALRDAAEAQRLNLSIVRIPTPITEDGEYVSYINGLRLDGVFLAPKYHRLSPEFERLIHGQMAGLMPGIEIVPVPARQLVELGGVIHCAALGLALGEHNPVAHRRLRKGLTRRKRIRRVQAGRRGG